MLTIVLKLDNAETCTNVSKMFILMYLNMYVYPVPGYKLGVYFTLCTYIYI